MKKLIILAFLVVSCGVMYTQNVVHIVRLNTDSVLKDMRFFCADVVDARVNKGDVIGHVYVGGAEATARFESGFTEHLKGALTKILPPEKDKLGLVLIIRDLQISEKQGAMTKLGFCRVEIEFAKRVDTLLYSLGIFDAHIFEKGSSITSGHESRILEGLEECCRKLDETNWENTEDIIIEDINHKLVYDYKSIPPKRVYMSFAQMLIGKPLEVEKLEIKQINQSKKNPVYGLKINNLDAPRDAIFVSDSENIYIRFSKFNFKKSTLVGKYIYFRGKFQPATNSEVDIAVAIGAAYVMAAVITGILTDVAVVSVGGESANEPPINGLVLDTETGQLKGLTDYFIVNITKQYPEIFKEYRASKRNLEAKENVIKQLNSKF